jgi:conjugal transfer pilus assembly protein TrbC
VLHILSILAVLGIFVVSTITSAHEFKVIQEKTISTKRNGLLIFVSFSMPSSLLIKLDEIARKAGGKLIIRGLKNNSFKETIAYIKQMQSQGIAVDIDPQAFECFDVQLVPAFVLSEGLKYDKITGNVSVRYALEQFVQHGDLSAKAKEYLKRLAYDEAN